MTVPFVFRASLLALSIQAAYAATPLEPFAMSPVYGQAVHGGVGLIQTPTARMNPDGEFSLNYQDVEEHRYWSASLQLFPWMETTMRYFDARYALYSEDPGFSGDQTHKDKGIDAKFRLYTESKYLPQIAIGFRDFGGTGNFASEYITLNKKFYNLDLSFGLGFGYLGRRANVSNPLCSFNELFCQRGSGSVDTGGEIEFGKFFRGSSAIYGGLVYQTNFQPLSFSIEFDPNDYKREFRGSFKQDSPWNYAARYRASDNLDLHLSYQRGNTVGFGITYRLNFNTATQAKYIRQAPEVAEQRPAMSKVVNRELLADNLFNYSGFLLNRYQLKDGVARIEGSSRFYRNQDEFVERASRVLANEVPGDVKEFRIIEEQAGISLVETRVNADAFVAAATRQTPDLKITDTYQRLEPSKADGPYQLSVDDGGFYTSVSSYWLQTFGSPETFYMYQGGLLLGAGYNLDPHWTVHGTSRVVVLTNFDDFKFKVDAMDTGVPRVRTYVREYVSGHDVSLDNLFVSWKDQLSEHWYGTAYAGLLEQMFTGVGVELLNRKVDRNFAYGVDLNVVSQRDFSDPFALRDYRTWTGHLNFYWQPEFLDDVLLKIKAGRYLAKDKGVTFEMNRRFDSGIVVGAYATKTNLSAAEYGEGSFTKGFFVSIPFDLFVLKPAKGQGKFPWVPISRDGGQPLQRPVDLYELTDIKAPFSR